MGSVLCGALGLGAWRLWARIGPLLLGMALGFVLSFVLIFVVFVQQIGAVSCIATIVPK